MSNCFCCSDNKYFDGMCFYEIWKFIDVVSNIGYSNFKENKND